MWECKYGKEPLDTRLCFLRLVRKSWLVFAMAVLGAVLFGGIYFLSHVVYGPAREYVTESEFYIEYVNAVTQEQQYTFYNTALPCFAETSCKISFFLLRLTKNAI